jgi:hypothetical protein
MNPIDHAMQNALKRALPLRAGRYTTRNGRVAVVTGVRVIADGYLEADKHAGQGQCYWNSETGEAFGQRRKYWDITDTAH